MLFLQHLLFDDMQRKRRSSWIMIWSRSSRMVGLLGLGSLLLFGTGCARTQSLTKAAVTKLITGGSAQERKQVYTLRRLKWRHTGSHGRILGDKYFTDTKLPITGAREKDTFEIKTGKHRGKYTVEKVLRIRGKKKRQVILKIAESFKPNWKTSFNGSAGIVTKYKESEQEFRVFTDRSKFPPDSPSGTQLIITGQPKTYTIVKNVFVKVAGAKLQRRAFLVEPPLPTGLSGVSYKLQVPESSGTQKLAYNIYWRGSSFTGYFYTIGINRRRYSQTELDDILKSEEGSKNKLKGVPTKRGAATVLLAAGAATVGVGGFLALVRRDDFPGAQQAIPWGIVGGGLLLLGISIPLNISSNNDYLAAAKAYNESIRARLKLPKSTKTAKGSSSPSKQRLAEPSHKALPAVGQGRHVGLPQQR